MLDKVGPWSFAAWQEFLELDCDLRRPGQNALAVNDPDANEVAKALDVRFKHPVLKALGDDADFKVVWSKFNARRRRLGVGRSTAPLFFLRALVRYAGLAHLQSLIGPQKSPRWARRRKKARKLAAELGDLLGAEIGLNDSRMDLELKMLLAKLRDELSRKPVKRERRSAERDVVRGFAEAQLLQCGFVSPTVTERFARMVHYEFDTSTIERYCNAVRREAEARKRQALANRLLQRSS